MTNLDVNVVSTFIQQCYTRLYARENKIIYKVLTSTSQGSIPYSSDGSSTIFAELRSYNKLANSIQGVTYTSLPFTYVNVNVQVLR